MLENPGFRRKKCLKFWGGVAVGLVVLLTVWIVGGNYVASVGEREIERDLAVFAQRFPNTEPNDAALKLAALAAKLGVGTGGTVSESERDLPSSPDITPSQSDRETFNDIRAELGDYLNAQMTQPDDTFDPPSEKLQRYLASKQAVFAEIRQQVLTHEAIHWGRDIAAVLEGNFIAALPSYLWQVDLQKVLVLDILENYRQGQIEAATQMLDVSWMLNQSLTKQPDIFAQLVASIDRKYPIGVMRKFDNLPDRWQQHLQEIDDRDSTLIALHREALYDFKFWQNFIWKKNALSAIEAELKSVYKQLGATPPVVSSWIQKMRSAYWIDENKASLPLGELIRQRISDWVLSKAIVGLKPVMKPYIRFSAIDSYRIKQRSLAASDRYNVCTSGSFEIDGFAWWNYIGRTFNPDWISNPISRVAKSMLDLELTQNILQVKALAAEEGKWPSSVPQMESSICPGEKWLYRVAPNGTMSISFSETPEWLEERVEKRKGLPFTYRDRTLPKSQAKIQNSQAATTQTR